MFNLCVFTCIIVMFVFHRTHVRMSYVLNSYLLTYLDKQKDREMPRKTKNLLGVGNYLCINAA